MNPNLLDNFSPHHYTHKLTLLIHIPPSILVKIVLVHLRKTSSTFSPVSALVSRKDSSTHNTGREGQNMRENKKGCQRKETEMWGERAWWRDEGWGMERRNMERWGGKDNTECIEMGCANTYHFLGQTDWLPWMWLLCLRPSPSCSQPERWLYWGLLMSWHQSTS